MKQSLRDEITSILHLAPIVDNLAPKTFVSLFITSLIQTRKVQFNELAIVLNDEAKITSNQHRIEDLFSRRCSELSSRSQTYGDFIT